MREEKSVADVEREHREKLHRLPIDELVTRLNAANEAHQRLLHELARVQAQREEFEEMAAFRLGRQAVVVEGSVYWAEGNKVKTLPVATANA